MKTKFIAMGIVAVLASSVAFADTAPTAGANVQSNTSAGASTQGGTTGTNMQGGASAGTTTQGAQTGTQSSAGMSPSAPSSTGGAMVPGTTNTGTTTTTTTQTSSY